MSRVEVTIPDPGDFDECEIVDVAVKAGDTVAMGDVVAEVATDKANVDVEAPAAGTVAEVLVEAGDTIPTDAVLLVIEA